MMQLLYGNTTIDLPIPEDTSGLDVWYPPESDLKALDAGDVYHILHNNPLPNIKNARVAIAVNDKTRPMRYDILLFPLLRYLEEVGIPKQRIVILISTGTHTPIPSSELDSFIPSEITSAYRILSHDCDDAAQLVELGNTTQGTPVFINKAFMAADIRITLGNIEPHHFMGFSGGAKTAGIGLAGRATIQANHKLMLQPYTESGEYQRNPMRQDLEEIGDKVHITACLNAIMDYKKEIRHVLWNSPRTVMQEGIPLSKQLCQVKIEPLYDIVIASAGGYPKDINLYQAQKGLTNAAAICKPGGSILLVAECREGPGNQQFAQFMHGKHSFAQVMRSFGDMPFQIGPHKAYLIARQGLQFALYLQSSMPDELVRRLLFNPISSPVQFYEQVSPAGRRIALLPYATATLPYWN
ncbi:MAG: nickel-dependent lactate racemase [Chloroflexi bacterium]|nr:nickel-dependent lactate racemase [Chloroflexota bacterium]